MKAFVSYSHFSENRAGSHRWKQRLLDSLKVLVDNGFVEAWDDEHIHAGWRWQREIEHAIQTCRVAVILLTPEALGSDFILNNELPALACRETAKELLVVPILCEPCDWEANDWLASLQIKPRDNRPLSILSAEAARRSLSRICDEIATALSEDPQWVVPRISQAQQEISPSTPVSPQVYIHSALLPRASRLPAPLLGRERELAMLDLAFKLSGASILSLVAPGGVGKTAILQEWLKRLQGRAWIGVEKVYCWSFYSQGTSDARQASEDSFLTQALSWFNVACAENASPWEKGRLLADAVVRSRTLLLLDGLEPLQYPSGPMDGRMRAPGVLELLRRLALIGGAQHSLCVVTTRQAVTDIATLERHAAALSNCCLRIALDNLDEETGARILHASGAVRVGAAKAGPDHPELCVASREMKGHALTLQLLGHFIGRAHRGDILNRALIDFAAEDATVQGGHTFRVLAAFENWFLKTPGSGARRVAVLRLLGLFDRPADAGCIAALRSAPAIPGLTDMFELPSPYRDDVASILPVSDEDADWHEQLAYLIDSGLLIRADEDTPGTGHAAIDCHPLVREHFAKRLAAASKDAGALAHRRLFDHLRAEFARGTGTREASTSAQMEPLFRSVFHGCASGGYEETFHEVFEASIQMGHRHFSRNRFASFGSDFSALACFLDPKTMLPFDSLDSTIRAKIFVHATFYLRVLGRLEQALSVGAAGVAFAESIADWDAAARCAVNLAEANSTLGNLVEAERHGRASVLFADRSGDDFLAMYNRMSLADTLHQSQPSPWGEAVSLFRDAELRQAARQPDRPYLYSHWGYLFNDLLLDLGDVEEIKQRVRTARSWADSPRWLHLDDLCLARVSALEGENDSTADSVAELMEAAVAGIQQSGQEHEKVMALLISSDYQARRGAFERAVEALEEARQLAERGPMRLRLADILVARVRLFNQTRSTDSPIGTDDSARADLSAAKVLIHECGYRRLQAQLDER